MLKKVLATVLAVALSVSLLTTPVFAATYQDTTGHWASAVIEAWSGYKVIEGYEGNFNPDKPITRAEAATIFGKIMKYLTVADNSFPDLSPTFWGYNALLKANNAGLMLGHANTGKIDPDGYITWDEMITVVGRALGVEPVSNTKTYPGAENAPAWSLNIVKAFYDLGYINNNSSNFKYVPDGKITRAQFIQLLDNAIGRLYLASGNYTGNVTGTAIASASGIVLQDMTIDGDLIIAEGVGNGDITLDNVTVTGHTMIRGGGANSVIVKGNSSVGKVTLSKKDKGPVSFKVTGNAKVDSVFVENGEVIITGTLSRVDVKGEVGVTLSEAKVTTLNVLNTSDVVVGKGSTVSTVNMTAEAEGSTLDVAGSVANVVAAAKGIEITGSGSVTKVEVSANNVSVDVPKTQVSVATGVTGTTAGGTTVSAGTTVTINTTGTGTTTGTTGGTSGGGGGGTSGGGTNNGADPDTTPAVSISAVAVNTATSSAAGATKTPATVVTANSAFSVSKPATGQNFYEVVYTIANANGKSYTLEMKAPGASTYTAVTAANKPAIALGKLTLTGSFWSTTPVGTYSYKLTIGSVVKEITIALSATGATVVNVATQAEFVEALGMESVKTINLTATADVTVPGSGITVTNCTVNVPSGATIRDYWKIGSTNKVVASAGANLRWGTGTTNNLFVGNATSTANIKLATGATFTVIGKAADKADYKLAGNATVQQQNGEPLVVDVDQTFEVASGTLTVSMASNTGVSTSNKKPTISVHSNGGLLKVNSGATLLLQAGALVVLGNGLTSINLTGTLTNNAGTFDGSNVAGLVGFVNSTFIPVAVVPVVNAVAPTFTTNLNTTKMQYVKDATATALTVLATVSDNGTVTYQWYKNDTSSTAGEAIPGATGASYTPETDVVGTLYYYVVATNTNNSATGLTTATAISAVKPIEVTAAANQTPVAGDFTITNPGPQTAGGSITGFTVVAKPGKSQGTVTIKYNGSTTVPSAVGTYTVTFDVEAVEGWNAATGLSAGTLTIEAAAPTTYTATVNIHKNGSVWTGTTKAVTLEPASGTPITTSGASGVFTATVAPATYKILVDDVDTGKTIVIASGNASVTLDYYSVDYAVTDVAPAVGSTIAATYDGTGISTGAVVLGGKTLVITATGEGATSYTYAWSGAGTNAEETDEITIDNLAAAVNATCAVTGSNLFASDFTFHTTAVSATYGDGVLTYAATDDTNAGDGAITIESSDPTVATVTNAGVVTIHKVGTTTITATKAATATHNVREKSYVLTVAKKALSVTALSATNKTYDKTTTVAITGGVLSGFVSTDDLSTVHFTTLPTSGTIASANVGNGKAVTVGTHDFTLTGTAAGNYTVTAPSVDGLTVDVSAKVLTFTGELVATYVPAANAGEGSITFVLGTAELVGVEPGDDVTIDLSSAQGEIEGGSNDEAVTVTGVVLGGADKTNYTIGSAQPSANNVNATTTVAEALTGTGAITGTMEYGQELTVALSGTNNTTGTLSYQWKSGGTNTGTNSNKYTLTADDIGKAITCEISSDTHSGKVTATATDTVGKATLSGGTIALNTTTNVLSISGVTGFVADSSDSLTNIGASYQWKLGTDNKGTDTATHTVDASGSWSCVISSDKYADLTVAAITVYEVTYDAGSEADTYEVGSFAKSGGTTTLPTTPPTRTNYTFAGWWYEVEEDGNNVETQFTASTTVAEDMTVYAKWNLASLYFLDNGEYTVVANAEAVTAATEVFYDSGTKTLTYWDEDESDTAEVDITSFASACAILADLSENDTFTVVDGQITYSHNTTDGYTVYTNGVTIDVTATIKVTTVAGVGSVKFDAGDSKTVKLPTAGDGTMVFIGADGETNGDITFTLTKEGSADGTLAETSDTPDQYFTLNVAENGAGTFTITVATV